MSKKNKQWYHNLHFEFYLEIPFVRIQTRLLKESFELMTYDICRLRFEITRPHILRMSRKTYRVEFQLYKRLR